MITRQWTRLILCSSLVLYFSQISGGQSAVSQVRKEEAIKKVRVASIPGWQEARSADGRFRILFPRKPQLSDLGSLKGFRLVEPARTWAVYYSDLEYQRVSDEAGLRSVYRDNVEATIKAKGGRLLTQKDVFLNGRLGTEFVVATPVGTVMYMRGFIFNRRYYQLVVDHKPAANGDVAIPNDVQKFFESFIYWDVS